MADYIVPKSQAPAEEQSRSDDLDEKRSTASLGSGSDASPNKAILDADPYTENPQGRPIGTLSAVFLIVNKIVGTGVFSTTSTILTQSGSVGMSLM